MGTILASVIVDRAEKLCKSCNLSKPISEFSPNKKSKDRLGYKCRSCVNEYRQKKGYRAPKEYKENWYGQNRERILAENKIKYSKNRTKHLKQYGLTDADYYTMYDKQEGKCGVCGVFKSRDGKGFGRLHVDHNHKTGKVRELLCFKCNSGLGHYDDNKEIIMKLLEYLIRND